MDWLVTTIDGSSDDRWAFRFWGGKVLVSRSLSLSLGMIPVLLLMGFWDWWFPAVK